MSETITVSYNKEQPPNPNLENARQLFMPIIESMESCVNKLKENPEDQDALDTLKTEYDRYTTHLDIFENIPRAADYRKQNIPLEISAAQQAAYNDLSENGVMNKTYSHMIRTYIGGVQGIITEEDLNFRQEFISLALEQLEILKNFFIKGDLTDDAQVPIN